MFFKCKRILFNLLFIAHACCALDMSMSKNGREVQYIFCIDGGGSKTELQVLDKQGNVVLLKKNGEVCDTVTAGCSNVMTVGELGIQKVATALLEGVTLAALNTSLSSITARSVLIGGFAGAGRPEGKAVLKSAFKVCGFEESNITIMTDADLVLEGADNPGIILIAGTGSICYAKYGDKKFRVGGLGRLIGDEGSGYKIGLAALKAALEEEYGWGQHTSLTQALRTHFNLNDMKNIVTPLYQNNISPDQVAALTPIVFQHASQHDSCALKIIDLATQDLGWLLKTIVAMSNLPKCPIYLVGGIFKSSIKDMFIANMLASAGFTGWPVVNLSGQRVATMVVQKAIQKIS